nr:hypothetical protein [Tanacetum cinerariifolium]
MVATLGSASASAGSVLKCLRSSKISGKARDRVESSPYDNRGGKRVVSSPVNNVIDKVLSELKSGSINNHLKFAMGNTRVQGSVSCASSKATSKNHDCIRNDGSFIKMPLDNSPMMNQRMPVAKSSDLKTSSEHTNMGDVGSISYDQTSSKDGITTANTGNRYVNGMAGYYAIIKHTGIEDVVNASVVPSSDKDGIASNKDGMDFEFGSRPTVMDKMTKEIYLKKAGKLDFARVLVEVNANEDLLSVLEIDYPPLGNIHAKVGKPRTEEELATIGKKQGNNVVDNEKKNGDNINMDDDGFVIVGKRNKPVSNDFKSGQRDQYNEMQGGSRQSFFMKKSFNKQGDFANSNGASKTFMSSMPNSLPKSLQQISKDPNFKPKVLLRGLNLRNSLMSVYEEALPTKNSFHLLKVEDKDQSNEDGDINVQEELGNKVWPTLKEEVDILMEAGIYPSKAIRIDWTIHQMDYFYKNCYKYNLDPSYEDDDVESEKDGIACDTKPEFDISVADNIKNGRIYTVYPIEEPQSLFHKKISLTDATYMVRNNITEEIKSALFDIDMNKAPGLDGFSSHFLDRLGLLLVMIYAKLSWNSLGLESYLKRGYARCAFKVDIQKVYDYVEWKFLESCLGKRGLRHGDPLSPYLFTLVMEILNLLVKKHVGLNPNFKFHWQCKDLNITHLCFTDDMMLFCHGDIFSVSVLKKALDEFRNVSGLLPSLTKSTVIFSNVKEATKAKILKIMPLSIGKLPAREVNEGFLWNFGEFKKGKAKMKWSDVYKPKVEILEVRSLLRDHIVSRIRDGKDTSLWFDNWHPICPLSSFIYKRNIHYSGLSLHSKMVDVIDRGVWAWPKGLSDELDGLNVIEPPDLFEDRKYKLTWKTNNGRHKFFNVSIVWNDLRDGN